METAHPASLAAYRVRFHGGVMTSAEALARFGELLKEREFVLSERQRITAKIQDDYRNEVIHLYRQAKPKAKNVTFGAAADWLGDGAAEVIKPYLEDSKRVTSAADETKKRLTKELTELAPLISLEPQAEESVYAVTTADSYRTQPGALGYASGRAKMYVMELAKIGVTGRVVQAGDGFEVRVPLDPVRVGVVGLRLTGEGFTLREFLKACWGNGLNPRVLSPMIPHGLEEKYGIDYFGNDIKTEPTK